MGGALGMVRPAMTTGAVISIHVDNAAIDLPLACSGKSLGAVPIETSFDIHNGSQLFRVDTTVPWQRKGGELLLH